MKDLPLSAPQHFLYSYRYDKPLKPILQVIQGENGVFDVFLYYEPCIFPQAYFLRWRDPAVY